MSLYRPGFVGVNLLGEPAPDLYYPGQTCPACRGVATFFYHDPPAEPELVCTDCLTGRFDSTNPDPPMRARLIGTLPGTAVAVYEYVFEVPVELEPPPSDPLGTGVVLAAGVR
jgi:hypothetical protein